jgi:hypothetical protein
MLLMLAFSAVHDDCTSIHSDGQTEIIELWRMSPARMFQTDQADWDVQDYTSG